MKVRIKWFNDCLFALVLVSQASPAFAITAADPGSFFFTMGFLQPLSEGWEFHPTGDITVNALGFSDPEQDGLSTMHAVGLFRVTDHTLLVSTTVTGDSPLDGFYRYSAIVPTMLAANDSYLILGTISSVNDRIVIPDLETTTFSVPITYECYTGAVDAVLNFPGPENRCIGDEFGVLARLATNFRFEVARVSEPGSPGVILVGVVGLATFVHWSRRRHAPDCSNGSDAEATGRTRGYGPST